MKKLLFLLITVGALSLVMNSCTKDEAKTIYPVTTHSGSGNGEVVTDYCTEIDDWAEATYPDATIDSVLLVTYTNPNSGDQFQEYVVYMSNGATAGFDKETCEFKWETCPTTFEPVCWNNTTYDNECLAIADGADESEIVDGECLEDCTDSCSDDLEPVCWNDSTYHNICYALCDGAIESEVVSGACPSCEDGCPTTYEPVCWNDVNYDNECLALCAGANPSEITIGVCGGNCIDNAIATTFPTATVVNIVSGYGNVNYGNAFYAVTLNFSGAEVVVYFDENCNYYSKCDCDTTVDIHCANSTTNYLNECEANCQADVGATITPGACN